MPYELSNVLKPDITGEIWRMLIIGLRQGYFSDLVHQCILSQISLLKYFRNIPPAVKNAMDKNICFDDLVDNTVDFHMNFAIFVW